MTNPSLVPHLCIAEGQRVTTTRGLVNIEDISVGDMVVTEQGPCRVTEFGYTGTKPTITLVFSEAHNLRCTSNHPIRVLDKEGNPVWKNAGLLKKGDIVLGISEYYDSTDIAIIRYVLQDVMPMPKVKVYDLTVEKAHHFIANGILVHNCKHLHSLATHLIKKDL